MAKAPPGMAYVKNPKTGKYRLVKVAAKTPTPSKRKGPVSFVQGEINRQINQDQGLTNYNDTALGGIADAMTQQANEAAKIAGQFAPVTAFDNPTLDAHNQGVVDADLALTNNVLKDQSGALAGLIAKTGASSAGLVGSMRAAGKLQHRDYSRYLQGQKLSLEQKRAQELLAMQTQRMQNQLAKDQFGLQKDQADIDNAYREANPGGSGGSGGGGEAVGGDKATYAGVTLLAAMIPGVTGAVASWKSEKGNTRSFNSLTSKLVQLGGLSPVMAARVAMSALTPAEIKRFAGSRKKLVASLGELGVNDASASAFANRVYGAPSNRPSVATGGDGQPLRPPSGAVTSTGQTAASIQRGVANAFKNDVSTVEAALEKKSKGDKVRIAGTPLTIVRIDRVSDRRIGIDKTYLRYHLRDMWGGTYRRDIGQ